MYIRDVDLKTVITENELYQLIENDSVLLEIAINKAIEECAGLLRSKFAIDSELSNMQIWKPNYLYYANQRVYLFANQYSPDKLYNSFDLVAFENSVFLVINEISNIEPNTIDGNYGYVGKYGEVFLANYPEGLLQFDKTKTYKKGDRCFDNNSVYTAIQDNISYSGLAPLSVYLNPYVKYSVSPGDVLNGNAYWIKDYDYAISTDVLITDKLFWTSKDSRNPAIVEKICDCAIYHLFNLAPPNTVPTNRMVKYRGYENDKFTSEGKMYFPLYSALGYFQAILLGDVETLIPKLAEGLGNRILMKSNAKNNNIY